MRSSAGQDKEEALKVKMASLGIKESDIRELFILSSKKGGQKVNKTSACVYLKHMPTGIEVKCQQERSQALNRFLARRILVNKVDSLIRGRESEEQKSMRRYAGRNANVPAGPKRRCLGIKSAIPRRRQSEEGSLNNGKINRMQHVPQYYTYNIQIRAMFPETSV